MYVYTKMDDVTYAPEDVASAAQAMSHIHGLLDLCSCNELMTVITSHPITSHLCAGIRNHVRVRVGGSTIGVAVVAEQVGLKLCSAIITFRTANYARTVPQSSFTPVSFCLASSLAATVSSSALVSARFLPAVM